MPGSIGFTEIDPPAYVPYMDLSGGLNTKREAHAIARNELCVSVNTWLGTGNAISKRPGSTTVAGGATGGGLPVTGLAIGRFTDPRTVLIAQQGTALYWAYPDSVSWTAITGALAASPGSIRSAQMYDPDGGGATTMFIVDGVDTPRTWLGPTTALGTVLTTGINCPFNHTNAAPITPKYVATAGFYLFYAGEPTEPSAVYISQPFHPQRFNISSVVDTTILSNPYIPYLVGFNDGVRGGKITGIEQLGVGATIMVYKENAIYRMDQRGFFGEMFWAPSLVSGSFGCLSPRSLIGFDSFHCFLGIDGVYQTDGSSTRRISDNVPTLFDATLSGFSAAIKDRTTAIGVRQGQRYLLFFDDGNGSPNPTGFPTTGVMFDFAKLDDEGLPSVSLIKGMFVGSAVSLRGPADDGNFVWGDATQDRIGKFGIGFTDFGKPISTQFTGKADFLDDVFGPDSPMALKTVGVVNLLVSAPQVIAGESLSFLCSITTDLLYSTSTEFLPTIVNTATGGSVYGTAVYGTAVYSGSSGVVAQFVSVRVSAQESAQGRNIQVSFQESSIYPYTILGYVLYITKQKVSG